MSEESKLGAFQAVSFLVLISITVFFAVPRLIGGIAHTRMAKEGVCVTSSRNTIEVWHMLFTGKLDGCPLTHNASVLQAQTLLALGALVLALAWGAVWLVINGPIGAEDLFGALVMVVFMGVAVVIVAVILIVWAIFWGFVVMAGLVAGFAATSRK